MKRFASQKLGMATLKILSIMAGVLVTGAVSTAIATSTAIRRTSFRPSLQLKQFSAPPKLATHRFSIDR